MAVPTEFCVTLKLVRAIPLPPLPVLSAAGVHPVEASHFKTCPADGVAVLTSVKLDIVPL